MPTENEAKFVLRLDSEPAFAAKCEKYSQIQQGYLFVARGSSLRVRSEENGNRRYSMTYKLGVKSRTIEIETSLDKRDFDDIWPTTVQKLHKVRYYCRLGFMWEVDAFKDHEDKTYFLMAELEMPEGRKFPEDLPPLMEKHLLYRVPLTDCRFASKLLADPRYATELYQGLIQGKGD